MSATGRSDVRDPDDHYVTPSWCVDAILPHLPVGEIVLDPGCGAGAIMSAVQRAAPYAKLIGVELNQRRAELARAAFPQSRVEWCDFRYWHLQPVDLAIGNPPFRLAMDFVRSALVATADRRGTVAMLLRIDWLSAKMRRAFHGAYPSDLYVLSRRPSFCVSVRCKGRDDCGWCQTIAAAAPRPERCVMCGGNLIFTASDASGYGWYVWGPGRGNRWFLLDTPESA